MKHSMRAAVIAALFLFVSTAARADYWNSRDPQVAAWTSSTSIDTSLTIPVDSHSTAVVSVVGTATITGGTVNFEASNDGGATWFPVAAVRADTATIETTFALAATSKLWQVPVGGYTTFRVRLNPAITGGGTITVRLQASAAPMPSPTVWVAGGSLGSNQSTNVTQVAGTAIDTNSGAKSNGTARVVIATDQPSLTNPIPFNQTQVNGVTKSTGQGPPDTGTDRVFVAQKVTYSFATTAKTATAAGTGPFFSICGSATKTIRLQQLVIGGTVATAAVYGDIELTKTSTATSAGTPTALTKVPNDSTDAASTANLLNFYTALATAGTGVGKIGSQSAVFPITGTVAAQAGNVIFDWSNRQESKAPVLIGTAQCIEASFGTTTTNAPTLTVQGWYTEE